MGNEQSSSPQQENDVPLSNLRNNHDGRKIRYETYDEAEGARQRMIKKGKMDEGKSTAYYNSDYYNSDNKGYHIGRSKDSYSNEARKKTTVRSETEEGGNSVGGMILAGLGAAFMVALAMEDVQEKREERERREGGRN